MIYLWISLSLLVISASVLSIVRLRKRRNVQYSLFVHTRSKSIKDNILNIQKISRAHKPAARNHSPTWTYRLIAKKWKQFRRNYNTLYSLQGEYDDLVPSCKWITDNYYLVNRNIKQVAKNFNKKNCRSLPAITIESSDYFPRTYVLAKELLSMMDNNFSESIMLSLVEAYQEINPLKISELWALPIMLKICLLDDVAVITKKIVNIVNEKTKADIFINGIASEISRNTSPEDIIKAVSGITCSESLSFSSQILLRLRERGFGNASDLSKVAKALPCMDKTYNTLINSESMQQASIETKVSNLIISLGKLNEVNWEKAVSSLSVVDRILAMEDAGIFSDMTFRTKETYRYEIETIASRSELREKEIAEELVALTRDKTGRQAHTGYYLIDNGRYEFMNKLNVHLGLFERLKSGFRKCRDRLYFLSLFSAVLLFAVLGALYTYISAENHSVVPAVAAFFILLIPGFSILTDIINQGLLNLVTVKNPPAMDFDNGIPIDFSTVIVAPVILDSTESVDKYIRKLEQLHLVSNDPNVFYAVLGDFVDHDYKTGPDDLVIEEYARNRMAGLTDKYFKNSSSRFLMFCRYRKWNTRQGVWMGWERKRGKLEEFNAYILGNDDTSFFSIYGARETLSGIRYVMTVDADTHLIRGNTRDMVGIMAHPLNHPVYDENTGKVTDGFGLMQPRVTVRLKENHTVFARLFAANSGFDPYTTFVSDIYQDVFYEGIFIGKGIYDLEVFHHTLSGRIPDNSVLSHDLLEGAFVRCGFASGVQVFDGIPPDLLSFFKRQHRWIRGDWQLLPWIFGRDHLKFLPRWQMFSNLLRSLEPISVIIFLCTVIFWFDWPLLIWLSILLFPTVLSLLSQMNKLIIQESINISLLYSLKEYLGSVLGSAARSLLFFAILPFRAYISLDAIVRTLYRLYISKRKMLEWQTQASVEKNMKTQISIYLKRMLPSVIAGLALGTAAYLTGLLPPLIIGGLWVISPLVSYLLGKKYHRKKRNLTESQRNELMSIARSEYRFFDEMMLSRFNYLVPDNFQTVVDDVYAPRTSPTNIGLQMMAFLSARDLGFISLYEFFDKMNKTMETIARMPKWHGHLYNWYDITNLDPLIPKYISSVDSGNLIGFLICIRNGLHDILDKPVFSSIQALGITYTMREAGFDQFEFNPDMNNPARDLEQLLNDLENQGAPWIKEDFRAPAVSNLLGFVNDVQDFQFPGKSLNELADEGLLAAANYRDSILSLSSEMEKLVDKTHFRRLYDRSKHLFHIGYNTHLNKYDESYYDFIASESRLTGYIAIAKGDIPQKHWYHLSRPLTLTGGCPTLLSWGGTMFEYFMPHLVMKSIPGTVFDKTLDKVLKIQMKFASSHGIPWGISESAYYRFDQNLNYQYRAFGVPSLGVRSDLSKFLVISPYSSFIAGWKNPKALVENLKRLKQNGVFGKYGFYESVDFMAAAGKEYKKPNIIKTYMCHHKGMSLSALDNLLNDNINQKRFHREPMIKSSGILLEERRQLGIVVKDEPRKIYMQEHVADDLSLPVPRIINEEGYQTPVMHVISNDRLQTVLSSTGTGYLKFKNRSINPWSSDPCNDSYGCFIYVKDVQTGRYFSISYSPVYSRSETYEVIFSADKAEYKRVEDMIDCHMEITVSPQYDAEIRRITLTSLRPEYPAELELISFMELSLENKMAYDQHPAFHKLFVETEFNSASRSVIAVKRPRSLSDDTIYFGSTCLVEDNPSQMFEYETERDRFIGRGRTLRNPIFLDKAFTELRGTGEVVDPCISLKCKLRLLPYQSTSVSIINAVAEQKSDLVDILGTLRDKYAVWDVFKNALFDSKVEMQYFNLNYEKTNRILDLLTIILYPHSHHLLTEPVPVTNSLDQRNLWKFGISGDNPIMLLKVSEKEDLDSVKDVVTAYEYLRRNQVDLDLVILNEKDEGYYSEFSDSLYEIAGRVKIFETGGTSPGVYILKKSELTPDECVLLDIVSRVTMTGADRILGDRISSSIYERPSEFMTQPIKPETDIDSGHLPHIDLEQYNGLGGFARDGSEYVIELNEWEMTPAPWCNVIANKDFGCICSEAGPGYTFCKNSRENKLTEWTNDPLLNKLPEIIYFRDDTDGTIFCPTTQPLRQKGPYRITHGFGYTRYLHESHGIHQELTVFVPRSAKLKYTIVTLENKSNEDRRISAFYYANIVLGLNREREMNYIYTAYDNDTGALTAENIYTQNYKGYTAYLCSDLPIESYTCDKNSFFRANCCKAVPMAVKKGILNGRNGYGLNPCAVIHTAVALEPGEKKTFCFILGQEYERPRIKETINKYGNTEYAFKCLKAVKKYWKGALGKLRVQTPDIKMNYMLNGWLQYQTLSCRLLARSSFYQSGGAFGFRDQLQDSLAFSYTESDITRKMIIKASGRQFPEGDVQHWWHDDTGIGVRTMISDDLLWLPYTLSEYIRATDDYGILREKTGYIIMPTLGENEHEIYGNASVYDKKDSIYEHAKKAIAKRLDFGIHGLPLIGSGDWNDGMNMIGIKGKGESVWLAFFLYDVMSRFMEIAEHEGDDEFKAILNGALDKLRENIHSNCWDGQWFLRAFFDDGTTLGSRNNQECRIDAISQSWSVISNAAEPSRARAAMDELIKYLVDDNERMILLLYPPFYRSRPNPGYIQGYLRGIRENGGQYTHGVIWSVAAASILSLNNEAYMLYDYLNPINHTIDETWISKYRLEPYVMPADIYYNKMQKGRGGWSWYTGSASWMYRVGIKNILGINKRGDRLYINPAIPSFWYKYSFIYKFGSSEYEVHIEKKMSDSMKGTIIFIDDNKSEIKYIPLQNDGKKHFVRIIL